MTDAQTLKLLDLTPNALEEYETAPERKLQALKDALKNKIAYLERRAAPASQSEVLLSDDQASYYFKQSLADLESSRLEGFELQRLMEKVRAKGKDADNRELIDKFGASLATNNAQWKLVTDFMGELFEQMMQRMAAKDVR